MSDVPDNNGKIDEIADFYNRMDQFLEDGTHWQEGERTSVVELGGLFDEPAHAEPSARQPYSGDPELNLASASHLVGSNMVTGPPRSDEGRDAGVVQSYGAQWPDATNAAAIFQDGNNLVGPSFAPSAPFQELATDAQWSVPSFAPSVEFHPVTTDPPRSVKGIGAGFIQSSDRAQWTHGTDTYAEARKLTKERLKAKRESAERSRVKKAKHTCDLEEMVASQKQKIALLKLKNDFLEDQLAKKDTPLPRESNSDVQALREDLTQFKDSILQAFERLQPKNEAGTSGEAEATHGTQHPPKSELEDQCRW